jgi:hypothetical protein
VPVEEPSTASKADSCSAANFLLDHLVDCSFLAAASYSTVELIVMDPNGVWGSRWRRVRYVMTITKKRFLTLSRAKN